MGNGNRPDAAIVERALQYAERGIPVFAVVGNGQHAKTPAQSNKAWSNYFGREVKQGEGGFHRATTDPETIRWMFSWRNARGIGIPTGKVSGIIVADFDLHKEDPGGNAHQKMLEYEDAIEATHRVRTRSGGVHAYFRYQPGHQVRELGDNIDIKSDGGYVLVPPTEGYRVENKVFSEDWDPPPWPPGKLSTSTRSSTIGRIQTVAEWDEEIIALRDAIERSDGQWHNSMVRLTAKLVGIDWSDAEILQYVPQWTSDGYTDAETFRQVATAVAGARAKRNSQSVEAIRQAVPSLTEKQLRDLHKAIGEMIGE